LLSSFGGYDTVRDTFLVGNLQGNFLASFAVGWACTTVSEGSAGVAELSVEQFSRVPHLRLILWTRSGVV